MLTFWVMPLVKPLVNLAESFIDNTIRDKVKSPRVGSVVYCDLTAGYGDHSGVYVGRNRIIHLNGDGKVESVSPKQFIDRLGGFNTAMSIYVSCEGLKPVGSKEVAERARSMRGKWRNYNVLMDNCHQFTAGCLTGDFNNANNFLWMLKGEVEECLGSDTWRVWDIELFE